MEILRDENKNWSRKSNIHRMRLMAIDPVTLFAYWEVDDTHRRLLTDHFMCPFEELPLYLRLKDVTDGDPDRVDGQVIMQIRVDHEADHWYFRQVAPHRRYVLDLVTTTFTGQYFAILRSNLIDTPPIPSGMPGTPNFVMGFADGIAQRGGEGGHAMANSIRDFLPAGTSPGESTTSPLRLIPYHDEFDGYQVRERGPQA